jgi:uncharacterized membrane-anchored protein
VVLLLDLGIYGSPKHLFQIPRQHIPKHIGIDIDGCFLWIALLSCTVFITTSFDVLLSLIDAKT